MSRRLSEPSLILVMLRDGVWIFGSILGEYTYKSSSYMDHISLFTGLIVIFTIVLVVLSTASQETSREAHF